jgi:hypothetical protein
MIEIINTKYYYLILYINLALPPTLLYG